MPRREWLIGIEILAVLAVAGAPGAAGQTPPASSQVETGQVMVQGRQVSYRIRDLPVSSFPELPGPIADALNARGCVVPQTYEAHHPENVIHGSLEKPGSEDWAVLCSVHGRVSLLVFFASGAADQPATLSAAAVTDRLQAHDATGELGFNWGIDPASPRRVREAQAGMEHRPPPLDHDCVADTTLDDKTIYHLYRNGEWEKVDTE